MAIDMEQYLPIYPGAGTRKGATCQQQRNGIR
jgi:hypothetical protein